MGADGLEDDENLLKITTPAIIIPIPAITQMIILLWSFFSKLSPLPMQQFLYFLPLPQGQGLFLFAFSPI